MAVLVKAGLPSREAAFFARRDLDPVILDYSSLRSWLSRPQVRSLSDAHDWPTSVSSRVWQRFCDELSRPAEGVWRCWERTIRVRECELVQSPHENTDYRAEFDRESACVCIYTPDYEIVARARPRRGYTHTGLAVARFDSRTSQFMVSGVGPV